MFSPFLHLNPSEVPLCYNGTPNSLIVHFYLSSPRLFPGPRSFAFPHELFATLMYHNLLLHLSIEDRDVKNDMFGSDWPLRQRTSIYVRSIWRVIDTQLTYLSLYFSTNLLSSFWGLRLSPRGRRDHLSSTKTDRLEGRKYDHYHSRIKGIEGKRLRSTKKTLTVNV